MGFRENKIQIDIIYQINCGATEMNMFLRHTDIYGHLTHKVKFNASD